MPKRRDWISQRHSKQGGSLNRNPKNNGSDKGPLRKVIEIITPAQGLFDTDYVEFECGHKGSATSGAVRGRCRLCKQSQIDPAKIERLKDDLREALRRPSVKGDAE